MDFIKNQDTGLLILRLSLGLMMLIHGITKIFSGVDFIGGMLNSIGLPAFFAYGVYVGEVLAPIALILGFRTRIAGAIMAFTMVVATLLAHAGDIFALNQYGGWAIELQGFFLFTSLALVFMGAGKYAVSTKNQWD